MCLYNRSPERIDTVAEIISSENEHELAYPNLDVSNKKSYMTSTNAHEAVMASIGRFKHNDKIILNAPQRRRTRELNSSPEIIERYDLQSDNHSKHYTKNSQPIEIIEGKKLFSNTFI